MSASRLLGLILVFSPLSILSIGGGQATIPEIQHQTVIVHGWLSNDEFADLFAIARAAPGPSTLIVALIGWQVAGFLGALVATLAIFVPSSIVMYAASSWWLRNEHSMVRKAIEQTNAHLTGALDHASDRFRQSVAEVKDMASQVQRELEATRQELRRGVLELPHETSETADAMRRVVSDQILALKELAALVSDSGAAYDVAEPNHLNMSTVFLSEAW